MQEELSKALFMHVMHEAYPVHLMRIVSFCEILGLQFSSPITPL